jgi:hypothetical protein
MPIGSPRLRFRLMNKSVVQVQQAARLLEWEINVAPSPSYFGGSAPCGQK